MVRRIIQAIVRFFRVPGGIARRESQAETHRRSADRIGPGEGGTFGPG